MQNNMRSTLIANEYLDAIMDSTLSEIIKLMETVFGPRGSNIFVSYSKDNSLYFTRDGKQVFNTLYFDNALAEQIKNVIGQAVNSQADLIGDSTTTVGLLTCHVIKELREYFKGQDTINRFDGKRLAKDIIQNVKEAIKKQAIPMNYGSEDFRSLVYTTTGDVKFIDTILNNIPEIKEDSIIDVQLNEMVAETSFEISGVPKLKTSLQLSKKPLIKDKDEEHYKLKNSVVLFVDGSLSFYKYQTFALLSLLSVFDIRNVVIVCASIDKVTNDALKHFQSEFVNELPESYAKMLSNIVVLRLPEYMNLERDEIIDINAIIYDDARDIGINKPFDFEHKVYHALYKLLKDDTTVKSVVTKKMTPAIDSVIEVEDYLIYDGDEEIIDIISRTLCTMMDLEVSNTETILPTYETPAKKDRVDKINEMLKVNRSVMEKLRLSRRLARFYSSKIIVKIGADIIANAQNEAELLLDALKASQRAITNGVIKTNGLVAVVNALEDISISKYTKDADFKTLDRQNEFIVFFISKMVHIIKNNLLSRIYQDTESYGKIFVNGTYRDSYLKLLDDGTAVELYIVEPVDAIIKVLDAVELGIDIAMSEVFTSKGFLANYI